MPCLDVECTQTCYDNSLFVLYCVPNLARDEQFIDGKNPSCR